MKIIDNTYIKDFEIDRRNSRLGRKASRLEPSEPREIAIHIYKIYVELTASEIRELKENDSIKFAINQDLYFPQEECEEYVHGIGEGEIASFEDVPYLDEMEDDEFHEIWVELRDGYAENL